MTKRSAEINEKVRERLRKLFAMLGSSNVSERENARQKIDELLARHRKTCNDLTELMQDNNTADSWQAAWDDAQSDQQHTGSAIKAGLPTTAVNKEPPDVRTLVHHIVEKHISMKPHERIATALWILYTHIARRFTFSPRLVFTSPVRGCGKTTALVVLEKLVYHPERMDNATPAAIYRLIDQARDITLLVDEADNLGLTTNGIMRSVFNSGHRQGRSIPRVIKNVTKKFSTFAPMAIAAIGILPLPLMERSIINHMEKAAPGDNIERFDEKNSVTVGLVDIVFGFVTRWSRSKLALNLDPDLPVELKHRIGRLADNWRPLIAIADSFGLVWGKVAREAAVTFARSHHDEDIGVILLSDIRNIFNRTGADRMTSVDLITALLDVEESGWSEYQGVRDDQQPRKVSAGEMARLLKPFGIRPRSVWPIASAAKASAAAKATTVRSASRLWHAIAMSQAAHRHKTVKSHTSEAARPAPVPVCRAKFEEA